jgi:hypothetical protein
LLRNEKDEQAAWIKLYLTKDTPVSYTFDGKPIPNQNIVLVYALLYPSK